MKIKKLRSWYTFVKEADRILREQRQAYIDHHGHYPLLFRGQSNATWHLETSLERLMGPNSSIVGYYSMIAEIQREISTFTNKSWDLPSLRDYQNWMAQPDTSMRKIQGFDYMAYLRHHAFPSPFLDWTKSPYIAAYFAFRDLTSKAKHVAIYKFLPDWLATEHRLEPNPKIFDLRDSVHSNQRHYLQQSVYTICAKITEEGEPVYANHEDVFADDESWGPLLTKYILPASERSKALRTLEAYNINAFSLWGTEDSLLETMSAREFVDKKELEEALVA